MNPTRDEIIELFARSAEQITGRRLPDLDLDAPFAELGFDSITLLELVGDLEERLGLRLPDDMLARIETAGELCEAIEAQLAAQ